MVRYLKVFGSMSHGVAQCTYRMLLGRWSVGTIVLLMMFPQAFFVAMSDVIMR